MKTSVISVIVEQHAEEAAFLWLLREAAVNAPRYFLKDLAKLDDRVEAHIDGLRIAGDVGRELCEQALQSEQPGEVFAASVLAFQGRDDERIDKVVTTGSVSDETFRGLVSALGWIPDADIQDLVTQLLTENSPIYRRLGISACAIHRKDPGYPLVAALNDTDPKLKGRALRTVGELGRRDLVYALRDHVKADDEAVRFWAAWSGVRLGDRAGARVLAGFASRGGPFRERALQLALRVMDGAGAQRFLQNMSKDTSLHRYVLTGAGIVGDPLYIPSLIKKMTVPELARVAGEAFSMITGMDLAYEDLEGQWPEGVEAGPTENPEDDDVAMDLDEDLPWPDPMLVQAWWDKNKHRFKMGTRYLCGQPISVGQCQEVLRTAYQRQRIAAALELALMQPEEPLFNTSAPGYRQQRLLA